MSCSLCAVLYDDRTHWVRIGGCMGVPFVTNGGQLDIHCPSCSIFVKLGVRKGPTGVPTIIVSDHIDADRCNSVARHVAVGDCTIQTLVIVVSDLQKSMLRILGTVMPNQAVFDLVAPLCWHETKSNAAFKVDLLLLKCSPRLRFADHLSCRSDWEHVVLLSG